jgi:predicted dehydrogenase
MHTRPMNQRSSTALGIGLVGVGRHGSRYVQHLLHDLPEAALTAICRKSGSGSYSGTDVPVYHDYHAMIADPRVEAVVIVTPPSLCHSICLTAVAAGKAVLVEKPLAVNGQEARAMVAAAAQRGVTLMTAQTMRFDPTILLLREQLRAIGPLTSATLISHIDTKANTLVGSGGPVPLGALLELGVHLLDLIRFLTGEEILDVECTMSPAPGAGPETRVQAQVRTSTGILFHLHIARVESQRQGRAELTGGKGKITADWVTRTLTRTTTDGVSYTRTLESHPTILSTLQAFIRAVRTRTPPPITGIDGCRAVEAADACYRSAAQHGAVVRCASGAEHRDPSD